MQKPPLAFVNKVTFFLAILGVVVLIIFGSTYMSGVPSKRNLSKLKPGMTPEDVRSVMGEPTDIVKGSGPGYEDLVWFKWNDGNEFYTVTFQGSILKDKDYTRHHEPG